MVEFKHRIQNSLTEFADFQKAHESAEKFLNTLGYHSNKKANINLNSLKERATSKGISEVSYALWDSWLSAQLLFQLTDDEIKTGASLFDVLDEDLIQSYLFFSIVLSNENYSRSELSGITRFINRLFDMPVLIVFRYGDVITFSIMDRRRGKRDNNKDVLEKVTLIKDIKLENTHRAHIEILYDLSFNELSSKYDFKNFLELHAAWQKTLDIKELNKKFYNELFNWYLWAVQSVSFPNDVNNDRDNTVYNSESVIRLLTRLIFVWFIKEKNLVPNELFDLKSLNILLKDFAPKSEKTSTYYRAILQNLFFATLNTPMDRDINKENEDERRRFININPPTNNDMYLDQTKYRYENNFVDSGKAIEIFSSIPFLNGGLFECLDSREGNKEIRYDGFSSTSKKQAFVPDKLFFAEEFSFDLNTDYGTSGKSYRVKGLINILDGYKFTITENTPLEEEIALDPELLGKVFENLLASYNPETRTTARKMTGSFYTPREIVNYMVDESILAYLKQKLNNSDIAETRLLELFTDNDDHVTFSDEETNILIKSISEVRILDPACGSGAFPMGILHRLVHLLKKLDPNNEKWNSLQIERAVAETADVFQNGDVSEREIRLLEINKAFDLSINSPDYARKLFLIENCIFGLDIQQIAIQISKLRFFISLIVDQKVDNSKPNRNILSMPNLETRFVAANTLVGVDKPKVSSQLALSVSNVDKLEKDLFSIRHKIFFTRKYYAKKRLKLDEKNKREELKQALIDSAFGESTAIQMASWNPFDPMQSAEFFDSETMFGFKTGFDIIIGNPPYKVVPKPEQLAYKNYSTLSCSELYAYFFEKSIKSLLKMNGVISFITASLYIKGLKFQQLRKFLETNISLLHLDVQGDRVFENVQMPTAVIIGQKSANENNGWNFEMFTPNSDVIKKIELNSIPLKDISEVMRGFEIGRDKVNSSGEIELITGSDVSKWCILKRSYITHDIESEYIKNADFFKGERILVRETGSELTIIYLESKLYCNRSLYSIKIRDKKYNAKYVIGLLNSKLMQFYYKSKFKSDTELFPKIRIAQVNILPIRYTDNQQSIIKIVDKILEKKKADTHSDISDLEKSLDKYVFDIFGLSDEDIKSIDPQIISE